METTFWIFLEEGEDRKFATYDNLEKTGEVHWGNILEAAQFTIPKDEEEVRKLVKLYPELKVKILY